VDLIISIWNVDLFIPEKDLKSPVKGVGVKSKEKLISTSATLTGIFRFDDGVTDNGPKGPSPGEVLQALTT
jgi:hypothetical protein